MRNLIISLCTMALKIQIFMFCNTNALMQPTNKKEKVTNMNNYSRINVFNDTSSWEPIFY